MATGTLPSLDETRSWIGREIAFAGVDEVSINDIRRKLEIYCFDCPLHYDEAVARAHGYRTVVAPVTLTPLWSMPAYWSPGEAPAFGPLLAEKPGGVRIEVPNPFVKAVNAASEWEYFEPLYPGDRIHGHWKLTEVKPRETKLGEGAFLTFEMTMFKQTGEPVASNTNTLFRYNPAGDAGGKRRAAPDLPAAQEGVDAPAPAPDWSRQLRSGEVRVGDRLPPLALWLSYQRIVMGVAADRMYSPIHHNRDQARANGLADIIFNTRGYEMLFELTLRQWMGLDGRIRKLGPFRMGASSHPGDVVSCNATVVETSRDGGRVKLEIAVTNARGEAAGGSAEVSLPV